MIEVTVRNYLESCFGESPPVYLDVPPDAPASCIVIEKTGSSEENHIKSAMLAIQSYADSLYEAMALNERVKEFMRNMIALPSVSKSALNSDYNYTDTATKKYRYQAVFDVVYFD